VKPLLARRAELVRRVRAWFERHDFVEWHTVEFDAAEQIGPEPLKMTSHDLSLLRFRQP